MDDLIQIGVVLAVGLHRIDRKASIQSHKEDTARETIGVGRLDICDSCGRISIRQSMTVLRFTLQTECSQSAARVQTVCQCCPSKGGLRLRNEGPAAFRGCDLPGLPFVRDRCRPVGRRGRSRQTAACLWQIVMRFGQRKRDKGK